MAKQLEDNDEPIINPEDFLSKPWRKFFAKFDEIDALKVSLWKEVHFLGYISRKYEQAHGRKFAVAIKNAPSKSPDIYLVKQIIAMLQTGNMRLVKEYIDWVYEKKKVKFRTLGFFLTPGFVNEFHDDRERQKNYTRSTELPKEYVELATQLGITISNYGDLAFVYMIASDNADKTNSHWVLIQNLELLGLDLEKLKSLK